MAKTSSVAATSTSRAGLAETIRTYDAVAREYTARVADAGLGTELTHFMARVPGPRVLDAGCGSGRDLRTFVAAGLEAVGLDLSAGMLDHAKSTGLGRLCRADLRALPLQTSTFDGVWACASLVHLSPYDVGLAVNEFSRVLKPSGLFFATVRLEDATQWREYGCGQRRLFYGQSERLFIPALRNAGFDQLEIETVEGALGGRWLNVMGVRVCAPAMCA